ncbi:hypothetical protein BKA80DRAFT_272590 [Phyllosticta citrichinensis]
MAGFGLDTVDCGHHNGRDLLLMASRTPLRWQRVWSRGTRVGSDEDDILETGTSQGGRVFG